MSEEKRKEDERPRKSRSVLYIYKYIYIYIYKIWKKNLSKKKGDKLQITFLKFGVAWILLLKILKLWFYTLKFSFVSNSLSTVNFCY